VKTINIELYNAEPENRTDQMHASFYYDDVIVFAMYDTKENILKEVKTQIDKLDEELNEKEMEESGIDEHYEYDSDSRQNA
jgi:hypothetical protein